MANYTEGKKASLSSESTSGIT